MKIQALLVDDELYPRQLLRGKLAQSYPEIEIIGEASNGEEAYQLIEKKAPDLVFLDISMPRESGFDLLRRLSHLDFEIIFVTSYDQFAMEAIEFCAIGYIVKPIGNDELAITIENAKRRINQKHGFTHNTTLLENLTKKKEFKKIALHTTKGLEFIQVKEIVRCEGYQKYTKIHLLDGRVIVSSLNIGKYIALLEPYSFYCTHKSHVVNLNYVSAFTNDGILKLTDGSSVPVSRRKKQEFLDYLKNKV